MKRQLFLAVMMSSLVLLWRGWGVPWAQADATCSHAGATVAAVDASILHTIYRNELRAGDVPADLEHVRSNPALARAAATSDAAAAETAVHALVYHPHWHIVRLRVFDARGRVLADIGGPDVIAPVRGLLRLDGRTVGSFLMSVQDDAGVEKLEGTVIGNPIGIYIGGSLAMASDPGFAAAPLPANTTVTVNDVRYRVVHQNDAAFPTGTVTLIMLVPWRGAASSSCRRIRVQEFARVAAQLARDPRLDSRPRALAACVRFYTGAIVIVPPGRPAGLATDPTPPKIATRNTVTYKGRAGTSPHSSSHP